MPLTIIEGGTPLGAGTWETRAGPAVWGGAFPFSLVRSFSGTSIVMEPATTVALSPLTDSTTPLTSVPASLTTSPARDLRCPDGTLDPARSSIGGGPMGEPEPEVTPCPSPHPHEAESKGSR